MNYSISDYGLWQKFLPLTYTRPISEIRVGILTLHEKWEHELGEKCSYKTEEYLNKKFPDSKLSETVFINASVFPNSKIVSEIKKLDKNQILVKGEIEIAKFGDSFEKIEYAGEIQKLEAVSDIFRLNGQAIAEDLERITKGRKSRELSSSNKIIGKGNVFLEEGATVEGAIFNTNPGDIYIGENAEVMEGAVVRGPFALCDNSTLKMSAKIYGPTTIGPHSKVGGEVNNSVFFGYSNKAHDGFLGNAVIGEWCNLGADTNNSNLKNNYAEVKLWSYEEERFAGTGLQFCGLIMGDHSKCGINTMFNTGTIVGVNANIFGSGFPRNFIPSFSWGGAAGMKEYKKVAAYYVAKLVMERRSIEFGDTDKDILDRIFELSAKYRKF